MNKSSIKSVFRKKGLLLITVFLVTAGTVYLYLVFHGYIYLNNPSKRRYPVTGVDLSHYQGTVDWEILSEQGIRFAYIKATEGSGHADPCFARNWEQAAATDLWVGAYHFFSFDSPGDTQAMNFISCVKELDRMLPPAVGVEYYADKKVHPPDPGEVRAQLQIMLDLVEEHYQSVPVIYSTREVWDEYLKGYFEEYPLWIRSVYTAPRAGDDWVLWQYSNRGRLKGYAGGETYIDLNVFHGSEEEWNRWTEKGSSDGSD